MTDEGIAFIAIVPIKGIITDKNILPITRLNFGRTQLASSSGIHTLGRFECSGQVAISGMPRSCLDLWDRWHTSSGFYLVMGSTQVESVYCDFTKSPKDPGKLLYNKSSCFLLQTDERIVKNVSLFTTFLAKKKNKVTCNVE